MITLGRTLIDFKDDPRIEQNSMDNIIYGEAKKGHLRKKKKKKQEWEKM